ncbi:hypothetical protein GGI07_005286 [Coemansia sp. Benny D115]|nr:hypothetical protein GGI07_005286 [Coemansia sp. Benny D115]
MPPKSRPKGKAGAARRIPAQSTVLHDDSPSATAAAALTPSQPQRESEIIEKLAREHWHETKSAPKWSEKLAESIMSTHIVGSKFSRASLQALERYRYLEEYLWPHFTSSASNVHLLSILLLANEKHRQHLLRETWSALGSHIGTLVDRVVALVNREFATEYASESLVGGLDRVSVRSVVAQFLTGCFGSLESEHVRNSCMPLVSVALWTHVQGKALVEREFTKTPQLRKFSKHLARRCVAGKHATEEEARANCHRRDFLPHLLKDLIQTIYAAATADDLGAISSCCKLLELLLVICSQLPTRRFANLLMVDYGMVQLIQQSPPMRHKSDMGRKFASLASMLRDTVYFQVDDVTGQPLSDTQALDLYHQRLEELQLTAYRLYPEKLEPLILATTEQLGSTDVLATHLAALDSSELCQMAKAVGLRIQMPVKVTGVQFANGPSNDYTDGFIQEAFAERYCIRPTVGDQVREISPYPTEQLLLSPLLTETDGYSRQPTYTSSKVEGGYAIYYPTLPLPRLGLQFLTLHDYLLRSFELLHVESAYEIRENVTDVLRRLQPHIADSAAGVGFSGWARMAMPLYSPLTIFDVEPPAVGELTPQRVRADICIDLANYTDVVAQEWDSEVRPRDVLILIAAWPSPGNSDKYIEYVRGCEVECRLDANGKPLNDESAAKIRAGTRRYFRVLLDTHQHHADMQNKQLDIYAQLNVVMRRRPQENNFKAVLETIRDMMSDPPELPSWLSTAFLGYGDPTAPAALHIAENQTASVNFGDTFLSQSHLRESFPDATEITGQFTTPCIVDFNGPLGTSLHIRSVAEVSRGPIELRQPKRNTIRFTPKQVAALRSASLPGLTLVVGPPGTGKTDVAVQAISNLYHNFPQQTTLLLTHSNQALNQLFAKIIALDIEPRHLLRLGHGESELEADERYTKAGRIESFMERRSELLAMVESLAKAMDISSGDFGYTCENARLFFISHVQMRWMPYARKYLSVDPTALKAQDIATHFPFTKFFDQALGRPLFPTTTTSSSDDSNDGDDASGLPAAEELVATVQGCYRYIQDIFDELTDIRPFELLHSNSDRSNYLLTNQARIVAMTCTHAALKRQELLQLGFRFDNVVMEEAAQVLDIETFIPLALQNKPGQGGRTLKRLIMIGDHNQLPPVVKNTGLRDYANMEQSLFTRLVKLGVPYIELDKQARTRPQIASLYSYRYRNLGNLDERVNTGAYLLPNPGFKHIFQFINVPDFQGRGESEPTPHFYQNLGEAEYSVALFQYMRLLGYPTERISILTTYQGQKALLQDVLKRRCDWLEYFGRPRVSTVDQYQGQQNDYVILSLVRTGSVVGHLRDLRRLTVALSRARLGLYVLGRRSVFEGCFELRQVMEQLLANGNDLEICPEESYNDDVDETGTRTTRKVDGIEDMGKLVYEMIERYIAHDDTESQEQ